MNDADRLEALEGILDELCDMCETHIALIEGNKDRRSLDNLGLQDLRTIEVQREGGPLRAAESVAQTGKQAIILTDWDDRGNRIENDLKVQLDALCIPYDTDIKRRLRDICIKDIKDVESLDSLYKRLKTIVLSQKI
jgi:5S rRNA maturation endonuclease (ribonuclease M5)